LNYVEHHQIKMNHYLHQQFNRMLLMSLSNDLFVFSLLSWSFFPFFVSLIYVFVSSHSEQQIVLYKKSLFVLKVSKNFSFFFLCLFLTRSLFSFFIIITYRPFSFNIYSHIYTDCLSLFFSFNYDEWKNSLFVSLSLLFGLFK
jgi:hypothetical protein